MLDARQVAQLAGLLLGHLDRKRQHSFIACNARRHTVACNSLRMGLLCQVRQHPGHYCKAMEKLSQLPARCAMCKAFCAIHNLEPDGIRFRVQGTIPELRSGCACSCGSGMRKAAAGPSLCACCKPV